MKRLLTILVLVVAVLLAAGYWLIQSGAYNVAASAGHNVVERWILETAMEKSVRRRAQGLAVPAAFQADQRVGFLAYKDMCAGCHGAPGVERSALGKGLTPKPPDLTERARDWGRAELFWIIKHGVKMSGMPAWGTTHSDRELWQVAAFVEQLPSMSPAQYRGLAPSAGGGSHLHENEGHAH